MTANALLRALRAIERRRGRAVVVMPRPALERLHMRETQPMMASSEAAASEHRAMVATLEEGLSA